MAPLRRTARHFVPLSSVITAGQPTTVREQRKQEGKPDPKPLDLGVAMFPSLDSAKVKTRTAKKGAKKEELEARATMEAMKPRDQTKEDKFVGTAWDEAGQKLRKRVAEQAAKAAEQAAKAAAERDIKEKAEAAEKAAVEAQKVSEAAEKLKVEENTRKQAVEEAAKAADAIEEEREAAVNKAATEADQKCRSLLLRSRRKLSNRLKRRE